MNLLFREKDICFICGKKVEYRYKNFENLCVSCSEKLHMNFHDNCVSCGKKIGSDLENVFKCLDCNLRENIFDKGASPLCYKGLIKEIIQDFKYNDKAYYKKLLGEFMTVVAEEQGFDKVDIIIPVPMSKRKKRIRGYNQAELLADEIANRINVDVNYEVLNRIEKFRESQTYLSRIQRERNMSHIFRVSNNHNIEGKDILLVDDVYTTGSTANNCSEKLKKQGAKAVFVLTAASTPCYSSLIL